jgi:hypothetical protein
VRIKCLALLRRLLLRVVEVGESAPLARPDPLEVDQDAGGDERPRERSATGLVDTGGEAAAV